MKTTMNNFIIRLGDTLGNGHCITEDIHIVCNKTNIEIYEGLKKVRSILNFDVADLCSEYQDSEISVPLIKKMYDKGVFSNSDLKEEVESILEDIEPDMTEEDMLMIEGLDMDSHMLLVLIFDTLKALAIPDLRWDYRDLNEEYLQCLDGVGYGLYYS